jgi:hypothetical protein
VRGLVLAVLAAASAGAWFGLLRHLRGDCLDEGECVLLTAPAVGRVRMPVTTPDGERPERPSSHRAGSWGRALIGNSYRAGTTEIAKL